MKHVTGEAKAVTGQSEVMGLLMVFAVSMTSIAVVMAMGAPVLDDARDMAAAEKVESEMEVFDSQVQENLYKSGYSTTTVDLTDGHLSLERAHTTVTVDHDDLATPASFDLTALVYDRGDTRVTYENGGIWRENDGGGMRMRRPPDLDHVGNSLRFGFVNFTGDAVDQGVGAAVSFGETRTREVQALEPVVDEPLESGTLTLQLTTPTYELWAEYLERSGFTGVDVDHPTETTTVRVPTGLPPYSVEHVANASFPGSDPDDRWMMDSRLDHQLQWGDPAGEQTVDPPTIEDWIERKVTRLESQGPPPSTTVTAGRYHVDGVFDDWHNEDVSFDVSEGPIQVAVADGGRIEANANTELRVTGSHELHLYVDDGTVELGDVVSGNDTSKVRIHGAGGEYDIVGNQEFYGAVYDPEGSLDATGSNVLIGAAVVDELRLQGDTTYLHDSGLRTKSLPRPNSTVRNFEAHVHEAPVR